MNENDNDISMNNSPDDSASLPRDNEPVAAEEKSTVYSYNADNELTDIRHYRRVLVEHVRVR